MLIKRLAALLGTILIFTVQDTVEVHEVVWSRPLGCDSGPITIVDGNVFLGSRDKTPNQQAVLYSLTASSGKLNWIAKFKRLESKWADFRFNGIRSKPAVSSDKVVFYNHRAEIVCMPVDKEKDSGDVVWKCDLRERHSIFKRDTFEFGTRWPSPVIDGERVFCATHNGSTHGIAHFFDNKREVPSPDAPGLVCLDLATGRTQWVHSESSPQTVLSNYASPALINKESNLVALVFAGGDGRVYQIDPKNGKTRWSSAREYWSWVSPVQYRDLAIVCSTGEPQIGVRPLFKSSVSAFQIEQPKTDKPIEPAWVFEAPQFLGAEVPPVLADGILFVISKNGFLFAIDPSNGDQLWAYQLQDYESYLRPELTVYKKWLLCPAGEQIFAFKIRTELSEPIKFDFGVRFSANVVVDQGRLFGSDGQNIYRFNASQIENKLSGKE